MTARARAEDKPSYVLQIRSSPHVRGKHSVERIMLHVLFALLPVTGFAVFAFGLPALLVIVTATTSCALLEYVQCRLQRKASTLGDYTAVITGLLLGLCLPPTLPLWMVAVGAVFAMWLGKQLFGGLGFNCFNPALVGRALLQANFPASMTTWAPPFTEARFTTADASMFTPPFLAPSALESSTDALTSATPLSAFKFEHTTTEVSELTLGLTGGCLGETCAVLILLGGAWLLGKRIIDLSIPASILGSVALLSAGLQLIDAERYPGVWMMLFSGGLMLGAVFMATDMVGSPMTRRGHVVYGIVIGVLVVVIRVWGGMPEGVMVAILLGNALVPHIDRWMPTRVFGTSGAAGGPA